MCPMNNISLSLVARRPPLLSIPLADWFSSHQSCLAAALCSQPQTQLLHTRCENSRFPSNASHCSSTCGSVAPRRVSAASCPSSSPACYSHSFPCAFCSRVPRPCRRLAHAFRGPVTCFAGCAKCLRTHNSPICSLSHNGYGTRWFYIAVIRPHARAQVRRWSMYRSFWGAFWAHLLRLQVANCSGRREGDRGR